jgi:hypothetical protein
MTVPSHKQDSPKATVLSLTLPEADSESKTGTLLAQRVADLTEVIADALIAFAFVEADPPVITELPPPKPQPRKQVEQSVPPNEPTVDIPRAHPISEALSRLLPRAAPR